MKEQKEYYYEKLFICLFLKGYIYIQNFENIIYLYSDEFKNFLPQEIYYLLITNNYKDRIETVSMQNKLDNYIRDYIDECNMNNCDDLFCDFYNLNDSLIELFIENNKNYEDFKFNENYELYKFIVSELKKKYEQKDLIIIDCLNLETPNELILKIAKSLNFNNCNNWDAINDFIFDIIPPKKLVIKNIEKIKRTMPDDAEKFLNILSKISSNKCKIEIK